jgi:hypothetical protein
MLSKRHYRTWGMLGAGILLGLTLGGATTVGVLLGQRNHQVAIPGLEELKLKAASSHGGENFAIATGYVDGDVEGLFTLDFLTGDLQCFVINPRTGNRGGWFKTNVAAHLNVEKGKKPSYLITTGGVNVQGGARLSASLVYVVDANTGEAAAFTFPWNKAATNTGAPQASEMVLVGKWPTRTVGVRQ